VSTETAREGPEIPVAPPEAVLPAVRAPADLAWTIVQMRAGERITVNEGLIAAYQAASSPHSIRALKSDVEAFDAWCRRNNRIALPATPETVADYLDARAGKGSRPASLSRYKASIAKIHQLLELKDPTPAPLVKLRLQTVRREKGAAQKGAAAAVQGPGARRRARQGAGLNIRALLESCGEDLPGLRDRALLSAAYDTGLRASELVAVAIEHIEEAIDPEAAAADSAS
jgi:site-specific recombinase XerD